MPDSKETEIIELINQHKGIMYKISRMYMDSAEDREDLEQEMMLRLWKSYESFQGKSAFSTWMYRVALNTAITFLRKEKRKPLMISADSESIPQLVDHQDHSPERKLQLFYKAVKELNPIEKALIFYFMEGLPHKEISVNLGISETNARVKLSRTKEKLHQIIKKSGYEF